MTKMKWLETVPPSTVMIWLLQKNGVSKILDFILFADDTNIFFSQKKVEKTLNEEELLKLTTWY